MAAINNVRLEKSEHKKFKEIVEAHGNFSNAAKYFDMNQTTLKTIYKINEARSTSIEKIRAKIA